MLTIANASGFGYMGMGAVVVGNVAEAIKTVKRLRTYLNTQAGLDDNKMVFREGIDSLDSIPPGSILLPTQEAAQFEAAIEVIINDIRQKAGVNEITLRNANAVPNLTSGYTVSEIKQQIENLLAAQRKATGASKFPLSTTLLAITGVALIGGLTVWGISRASTGRRRRRSRSRR
jgi:hypothetical protein